jgi:polyhydroxyalkanoate synthesis regulator phasin
MPRREAESLISKLRHMSEEGVASFFSEVMANESLRRTLGRAGESFLSNKQSFDRNIETILDFVNIPSKRDVRELKARLDHLNGQLVNLSMKIDRMLAEAELKSAAAPGRASKARGARKRPGKSAEHD